MFSQNDTQPSEEISIEDFITDEKGQIMNEVEVITKILLVAFFSSKTKGF